MRIHVLREEADEVGAGRLRAEVLAPIDDVIAVLAARGRGGSPLADDE